MSEYIKKNTRLECLVVALVNEFGFRMNVHLEYIIV